MKIQRRARCLRGRQKVVAGRWERLLGRMRVIAE